MDEQTTYFIDKLSVNKRIELNWTELGILPKVGLLPGKTTA